ncbi:MAG: hypothetical protein IJ328_03615 [Muribaculaceae bacterium]|nr:hypothetical protein [Muribaculaceae bacterium]
MAKRIVTRIGDIFCVEIDGEYKCYFQFLERDVNLLNSDVIRAFKTRYPIDYEPVLSEIVRDDVLFYTHTFIRVGLEYNAWYKIGRLKPKEPYNLTNVKFGTYCETRLKRDNGIFEFISVSPLENWTTWYVNRKYECDVDLKSEDIEILELGGVMPYSQILYRIKYGYFLSWSKGYDIIKRRPIAGVNSYTKHEIDGNVCYFHYIGEDIHREIIITPQGVIKLTQDVPERNGYTFHARKFWEINWAFKDHISEDDFLTAWNKYT